MKKLIPILSLFICISSSLHSQNVQFEASTSSGGGFDVSTGIDQSETIMIDGTSYDVFATNGGSLYIICNSPKTGNDYPVWIGSPTSETYDSKPVRVSKKGTYFVLIKSKNTNNPYCKYLKISH